MKMTDEQMKALVKFARGKFNPMASENLLNNYSRHMMVKICYNLNVGRGQYY